MKITEKQWLNYVASSVKKWEKLLKASEVNIVVTHQEVYAPCGVCKANWKISGLKRSCVVCHVLKLWGHLLNGTIKECGHLIESDRMWKYFNFTHYPREEKIKICKAVLKRLYLMEKNSGRIVDIINKEWP